MPFQAARLLKNVLRPRRLIVDSETAMARVLKAAQKDGLPAALKELERLGVPTPVAQQK